MFFSGTAHRYGDHVNTDVIIPARYCSLFDEKELAGHCMEDLDEHFAKRVRRGDILVAGKNFGCGSSREAAVTAIKASGIACIIAESFARIFFRNAINNALPVIECRALATDIQGGEKLKVDLDKGRIAIQPDNRAYLFPPSHPIIVRIFESGGLINYVRLELERLKNGAE